jgi:hypothetical protein
MSDPNFYDIMPAEEPSLPSRVSSAVRMAINTVKEQISALQMVTASDEFLTGIAVSLTHNQKTWAHIPAGNQFHTRMVQDIQDTCPKVPDRAMVFLNITHRWVLVAYDNHVLPLVFVHKGQDTALYRLIIGQNSRWLPVFFDKLQEIYLKGPNRPQEISFEPEERLASGPDLNKKWKVGGVHLDTDSF